MKCGGAKIEMKEQTKGCFVDVRVVLGYERRRKFVTVTWFQFYKNAKSLQKNVNKNVNLKNVQKKNLKQKNEQKILYFFTLYVTFCRYVACRY